MSDQDLAFDLVRYRVHKRRWSSISAILAETGASATETKIGLQKLHGLHFNSQKDDPFIFFTEDTQQRAQFRSDGVLNPTLLQILLTSRVFDLDEDRCKERFEKMLKGD